MKSKIQSNSASFPGYAKKPEMRSRSNLASAPYHKGALALLSLLQRTTYMAGVRGGAADFFGHGLAATRFSVLAIEFQLRLLPCPER